MSTELYLYDKESNDVICLRDIIDPDKYQGFVSQYIYTNGDRQRADLRVIIDDEVDTYHPYPKIIEIKLEKTMARNIMINRDEAELLVDLLEENYRTGKYQPTGVGADLASEIRELFGMMGQTELKQNKAFDT